MKLRWIDTYEVGATAGQRDAPISSVLQFQNIKGIWSDVQRIAVVEKDND